MKLTRRGPGLGLALLGLWLGLAACGDNTAEEEVVNLEDSDPRAILAPGKAGTLSGATLLVPRIPDTYHIYSVPEFAGVESPGEIGIGSSIGYNPGERVLLPINVNLGTEELGSYSITLFVNDPSAVEVVDVDGSYGYLADTYPDQYHSAPGFEAAPVKVSLGDTITLTATSAPSASGRINLANITVDILAPGPLPDFGAVITFTVNSLQTPTGEDVCAQLGACTDFDAILIENFKIQ